jgi:hypothetical protein
MEAPSDDSADYKEDRSLSYTDTLKKRCQAGARLFAGICLFLGFGSFAYTQGDSPIPTTLQKETVMNRKASGTFEVKVIPQAQGDKSEDASLGRMSLDKQFHGDLEAVGKGQMLTAGTEVKDSAGYVAIERVSGTLDGQKGSFVLQHSGTMNRGEPQLTITVVPDSGTDQLAGLAGGMTIKIADGKHFYDFEYTIAKTP